jgi:hypothetical protein
MHAVAVRVSFNDVDAAEEGLHSQIVPMVKQAPGFVSGWWTRSQDRSNGLALMVFESEDAAQAALERLQSEGPGASEHVNVESAEVREVVANA